MTTEDAFQLSRLASELKYSDDDGAINHDLPDLLPLDHNNPLLIANAFDVEQFLLSRSYTSLLDLRTELRDYLATLKSELVQLINDDYEAFISLSTDLKDEGPRLNALKEPLHYLKSEILVRYPKHALYNCTQF
jgi:conserved oligomeric Golgi complex subunit 2